MCSRNVRAQVAHRQITGVSRVDHSQVASYHELMYKRDTKDKLHVVRAVCIGLSHSGRFDVAMTGLNTQTNDYLAQHSE